LEWPNFEKYDLKIINLLKILICEKQKQKYAHDSCDICSCDVCTKIEKKIHPDIIYIEKCSLTTIGIEEIRKIRKSAYIMPNEAKYKIYIVKYGELLTPQAQNAFLKILEEPPKNVIFIVICDNSSNLLKTIKSRFQIFGIDNANKNQNILNENLENIANNCFQAFLKRNEFEFFTAISEISKHKTDLISINNRISQLIIKNMDNFSANEAYLILKVLKKINFLNQKNINNNLAAMYYFLLIKNNFYAK
jgi:DNA polymerase III gamma/tau subunit